MDFNFFECHTEMPQLRKVWEESTQDIPYDLRWRLFDIIIEYGRTGRKAELSTDDIYYEWLVGVLPELYRKIVAERTRQMFLPYAN